MHKTHLLQHCIHFSQLLQGLQHRRRAPQVVPLDDRRAAEHLAVGVHLRATELL